MVVCTHVKVLTAAALFAAEIALAMILLALATAPSGAQFFFDNNYAQRGLFNWFAPAPPPQQPHPQHQLERAPPPVDYSKAPAPKTDPKAESAVTTPILVLGDSMADWLGYGLELAYADSPEIGILRRHRTNSGLIRTEVRSDSRGEYPDWRALIARRSGSQFVNCIKHARQTLNPTARTKSRLFAFI